MPMSLHKEKGTLLIYRTQLLDWLFPVENHQHFGIYRMNIIGQFPMY